MSNLAIKAFKFGTGLRRNGGVASLPVQTFFDRTRVKSRRESVSGTSSPSAGDPKYHVGVRRLRRIILNALTFLSLLICLATAGLWVRSYWVRDELQWYRWSDAEDVPLYYVCEARFIRGTLMLHSVSETGMASFSGGVRHKLKTPTWLGINFRATSAADRPKALDRGRFDMTVHDRLGFSRWQSSANWTFTSLRFWGVSIPLWTLAVATLLLPLTSLWQLAGLRSRRRKGSCLKCGYDLRATPDRCPECGAGAVSNAA